jgi:DNA invertase Pin-like site-specific DNA recombinase
MRVVGYTRVSTVEQGDSGAGLDAQEAAIRSEARRRGWELVATLTDTASGKSMRRRPGLDAALAMIERGDADALVVAKVDRLSRSLLDFAGIVERSRKQDWQLVALDLGVDTTTPQGEMLASVLAVFAQFERRLIGERTKDALAVKRANGVQLGRPRSLPRSVVRRITRARTRGETWSAIADELNRDEVPTAQGGRQWWPATVRKIAQTA